jgi:hypothetical protein
MAQETQYWSFRYILGTEYSLKTEASEISPAVFQVSTIHPFPASSEMDIRIAADSTMFLIVNLLIALSFGVQREQLEHRIGLTWPRPFLLRPLHYVSILEAATTSGLWNRTWTLAS